MLARYCPRCEAAMAVQTETGEVVFACACGTSFPGGPEAARLGGARFRADATADVFRQVIENSFGDRTNSCVLRDCPDCGVDHSSQLILGTDRLVVLVCDGCGRKDIGAAAAAALAAGADAGAGAGAGVGAGAGAGAARRQGPGAPGAG